MTSNLIDLHIARATHSERLRAATGTPRTSRRIRRGAGRSLRGLLTPPRLQPRPAW